MHRKGRKFFRPNGMQTNYSGLREHRQSSYFENAFLFEIKSSLKDLVAHLEKKKIPLNLSDTQKFQIVLINKYFEGIAVPCWKGEVGKQMI